MLVPKLDRVVCFCEDFRKVMTVSKFDAYPMPRIDCSEILLPYSFVANVHDFFHNIIFTPISHSSIQALWAAGYILHAVAPLCLCHN